MLRTACLGLLLLSSVLSEVSAQNNQTETSDTNADRHQTVRLVNSLNVEVGKEQYEVARAAFMPHGSVIATGKAKLHCTGKKEIKDKIYWLLNGVRVQGQEVDDPNSSFFRSIYTVADTEEAYYSCNGVGIHLLNDKTEAATGSTSMWIGSTVTCIDQIAGQDITKITKTVNLMETEIKFFVEYDLAIYPVKDRKVERDLIVQCNNTDAFSVLAVQKPTTTITYKSKKVICTSSESKGRCDLKIYFGDSLKAEGKSPVLEYKYGNINIKQVSCEAECQIEEDVIVLPVKEIEINRTLFICVIFVIVLIIIIIIVIVCCVLWHKFGFKEKYGYQINMRLKKSFDVDNKLSSYRLSGVEADAADEDSDEDIKKEFRDMDETKEFRDMDETGSVDDDSFVDPNFAKTNQKIDMRSKDDVSNQPPNQRPFLRI